MKLNFLNNKNRKEYFLNNWFGILVRLVTFFVVAALFAVALFIFIRSLPFLKKEGLSFIFKENWIPSENQFGIWNFVISTFWTVFFTMILVAFLNVFTSLFISKFVTKKLKKFLIFFAQFFSGIPSICFGTFGAYVFVDLFRKTGIAYPHSMMTVILVLTIMILPTTIVLSVNAFDNVSKKYELSAYALGINKVTISFKIIKKICSKTLLIILFFGFCRAIGEVTAIALIAGNSRNAPSMNEGFVPFFFSSIRTLSSLIGLEIGENFGKMHESALFSISGVLLFVVLIVNLMIGLWININWTRSIVSKKTLAFFDKKKQTITSNLFVNKLTWWWFCFSYWMKWFFLIVSFIFVYSMFFWILGDICYKGIANFRFKYLVNTQGDGGLLSVILVTLILLLSTVIFSFPLALFVAIFLVFYGKKNRWVKKIKLVINGFIYQFSSAPTVIFGMFGLAVFVSYFSLGFSIFAASLTIILIVLPVMIQTIKQDFEAFPQTQYESAIALGLNRQSVILKLICPTVFLGFVVALIFGINKVIAESSPVLITMGTTNAFPKRGIFSNGRTLSTHMYLLQGENLSTNTEAIVYQTAFLTLFFLFLFNLLTFWLVRKKNTIKGED